MTWHIRDVTEIGGQPLHPETLMMGYGYFPGLSEGAVKCPIFQTSTFVFRSAEEGKRFFELAYGLSEPGPQEAPGLIYSRLNNPNLEILEGRLAIWDRAERALVFSSGMAAISTCLFALCRPGDVVVHSSPVYGGSDYLLEKVLPQFGIRTIGFQAGTGVAALERAVEEASALGRVAAIFVETPANPTNALIDLAAVRSVLDDFAQRHGYRPIAACDNTLLGPIFQHPIRDGIDLSAVAEGFEMMGVSSTLYPALKLEDMILANVVVVILGILTSLLPAWRASRYRPVEAIAKT